LDGLKRKAESFLKSLIPIERKEFPMKHSIKTHIVHAVHMVRHALRDHSTGGLRSGVWPKVEHDFKSKHPTCAACGGVVNLNVHHMKPFHLDPALELDETNLITLCMEIGHDCHLLIGHGDDFKAFNPNVSVMAAATLACYKQNDAAKVKEIEAKAKDTRQYELKKTA
jgi:5-methylcytosine-specific restriction enzyme A